MGWPGAAQRDQESTIRDTGDIPKGTIYHQRYTYQWTITFLALLLFLVCPREDFKICLSRCLTCMQMIDSFIGNKTPFVLHINDIKNNI